MQFRDSAAAPQHNQDVTAAAALIRRPLRTPHLPAGLVLSPWQATFQRATRWVAAMVLLVQAMTIIPVLLRATGSTIPLAVLLLLVAQLLGTIDVGYRAVAVSEPTSMRRLPFIVALILMMSLALAVLGTPRASGPPEWLALAPPIIAGYVASTTTSRRGVAVIGLIAGVVPATLAFTGQPSITDARVHGLVVLMLVGGTAGMLTIRALRRSAAAADAWVEHAIEASAQAAVKLEGERRQREVGRFVHDEILHFLQVIAMEPGTVPQASVRTLAGDVLSSFSRQIGLGNPSDLTRPRPIRSEGDRGHPDQPEADIVERLTDLVADLARDAAFTTLGGEIFVPDHAADALVRATAEAIRNAQRHSGASATLAVVVSGRREQIVVSVTDSGIGFLQDSVAESRHGVRDSIIRRMQDVGGAATVTSEPGEGTRVLLAWQPDSLVPRAQASVAGGMLAGAVRDLCWCLVPYVAWVVYGTFSSASHFERAPLAYGATVLLLAGAALAGFLAPRGGPGPLVAAGLSGITVGVIAMTGLAIGSSSASNSDLYLLGPAATLLIYAMTFRPLRETAGWAALTCLVSALTCWRAAGEPERFVSLIPSLGSVWVTVAAGLMFRSIIDAYSRSARASAETVARVRATQAINAVRHEAAANDLADIMDLTQPLIEGVASGAVALDDPTTAQAALELEGHLRCTLTLPSSPVTRRAVAFARMSGWIVGIRADRPLSPSEDRSIGRLLTQLASDCAEVGRVDLTVWSGSARSSVSAVITPVSECVWVAMSRCADSTSGHARREATYLQIQWGDRRGAAGVTSHAVVDS